MSVGLGNDEMPLLLLAVSLGDLPTVRALVAAGADPTAADAADRTAVHHVILGDQATPAAGESAI